MKIRELLAQWSSAYFSADPKVRFYSIKRELPQSIGLLSRHTFVLQVADISNEFGGHYAAIDAFARFKALSSSTGVIRWPSSTSLDDDAKAALQAICQQDVDAHTALLPLYQGRLQVTSSLVKVWLL